MKANLGPGREITKCFYISRMPNGHRVVPRASRSSEHEELHLITRGTKARLQFIVDQEGIRCDPTEHVDPLLHIGPLALQQIADTGSK